MFTAEKDVVKANEIIVESHNKNGFKTIQGKVSEGNFHIVIFSNFGYGKASYLSLQLYTTYEKIGKNYFLNFDDSLHSHRGMRHDSVMSFFFDPESQDKWNRLFNLIIEVYNNRERLSYYGSPTYVANVCLLLRDNANNSRDGFEKLLEHSDGFSNLSSRCKDLLDGISHSGFKSADLYLGSFINYKKHLEEKSAMYVTAAKRWLEANNCAHEHKYKDVRILANEVSKFNKQLEEELSSLHIREIDLCTHLVQVKDDIWYGQYTDIEITESDSSRVGKWIFVDNSTDKYISIDLEHDGKKYDCFESLLPSKSSDRVMFTVSPDNKEYYVVEFENSELKPVELDTHYDKVFGFSHNIAMVQKDGKYGIINANGEVVLKSVCSYIEDFYREWKDVIRVDKDDTIMQQNLNTLLDNTTEKEIKNTEHQLGAVIPMPIKEVSCVNFKRFEKLENLPIRQVNFIVGANNAGKSTYIELIQLLMHIIPMLKDGVESIEQYLQAIVGRSDSFKEIWWKQGKNEYAIDDKDTLICDFDVYGNIVNRKHPDKPIEVSMTIGEIIIRFSLHNKDNEKCFVEIKNSENIGIILKSKSVILSEEFQAVTNIHKESDDNETSPYEINNNETSPYKINVKGTSLDEIRAEIKAISEKNIRDLNADAQENVLGVIDKFFTDVRTAISAATEVKHIGVWEGKINIPYCRDFFDSEGDKSRKAIKSFVKKNSPKSTGDDIENMTTNIVAARDKHVIPFINRWIKKFELGNSFSLQHGFGDPRIKFHIERNGKVVSNKEVAEKRSYYKEIIRKNLFYIDDKLSIYDGDPIKTIYIDGEKDVNKEGTGTKHLISLIFTFARIMLENIVRDRTLPVILVEEPEQNLHPKWQSLLTDFFWDITRVQKRVLKSCNKCKNDDVREVQIIIETHSEYIIRRSQMYVKTFCESFGELEESPFSTFYFPTAKDEAPYDMEYMESGHFKHEFGQGFFDEAARLSFDISSL